MSPFMNVNPRFRSRLDILLHDAHSHRALPISLVMAGVVTGGNVVTTERNYWTRSPIHRPLSRRSVLRGAAGTGLGLAG